MKSRLFFTAHRSWLPAFLFLLTLCLPLSQASAQNIYLLIPGAPGESTNSDHRNEILVSSFAFGLSVSNSSAGGASISKPILSDIFITKSLDRSSPKIIEFAANSKSLAKVTLTVTANESSRTQEFYTIELSDVLVTSYSVSGAQGASRPTDSFALNYRKAIITYKYYDLAGALKDTTTTTLTAPR